MNFTRHSNFDIGLLLFVALYNLALIGFTLLWLFTNALHKIKSEIFVNTSTSSDINEIVTYGIFFSGVLGGCFYGLRALYQRLGQAYTPVEDKVLQAIDVLNIKVWFLWYLYRPIQGGILALVLLALLYSKLMLLEPISEEGLKSYYTLVALGFLSGFGSHELIHKIQELINVLFSRYKVGGSNAELKVKENNGSK